MISQQEAHYRRGSPMKHCGVCVYYEGGDACSKVASPISGFGISDIFEMQKNPFPGGPRIGPQEAQMVDGMMSSPPDQSPHVGGAPATRIGKQAYP